MHDHAPLLQSARPLDLLPTASAAAAADFRASAARHGLEWTDAQAAEALTRLMRLAYLLSVVPSGIAPPHSGTMATEELTSTRPEPLQRENR